MARCLARIVLTVVRDGPQSQRLPLSLTQANLLSPSVGLSHMISPPQAPRAAAAGARSRARAGDELKVAVVVESRGRGGARKASCQRPSQKAIR